MLAELDKKVSLLDKLIICEILLLAFTAFWGGSFSPGHSYEFMNQYGEIVDIYGYGIYAHDSLFKVPIFIGTDLAVLFLITPLLIIVFAREMRHRTIKNKIFITSVNTLS